jgi:hypothetical protein
MCLWTSAWDQKAWHLMSHCFVVHALLLRESADERSLCLYPRSSSGYSGGYWWEPNWVLTSLPLTEIFLEAYH